MASIKRSTRATVASVKQRCGDGGVDQSGGATVASVEAGATVASVGDEV